MRTLGHSMMSAGILTGTVGLTGNCGTAPYPPYVGADGFSDPGEVYEFNKKLDAYNQCVDKQPTFGSRAGDIAEEGVLSWLQILAGGKPPASTGVKSAVTIPIVPIVLTLVGGAIVLKLMKVI